MGTPVQPTGNPYIDGVLWGWRWDRTDLTVSFPTSVQSFGGYAFIEGFQPFTSLQANQIVNFGLNNLGVFTNLRFSFDPSGFGDLRFAQAERIDYGPSHFNPGLHVPGGFGSAEANPPDDGWIPAYAQGDNWFTIGAYEEPLLGSFQYTAGLLHEVGHSLGLKHGHAAQEWSFNGGQTPTFPVLPPEVNSQEFSVMTYASYVGADVQGGATGQEEYPWTYMMLDVAALQYLYGANFGPGTNNTDTTYRFDPQSGELFIDGFGFGPSYNGKVLATLWDGGGRDHFDFSNHGNDQSIDLRPGAFSTFSQAQLSNLSNGSGQVNLARGNIANPLLYQGDLRSLIEDVTTGGGADRVIGNQVANLIRTGPGFDTVSAGEGNDTVHGDDGRDLVYLNQGDDLFVDTPQGGDLGRDTVFGGLGDDTIEGGNGDDVFHGEAGADVINGRLGNDLIFGGDGFDTVSAGEGADTVHGGNGRDLVWLNQGNDLFVDNGQGGDLGRDTVFGGFGSDRIEGGNGDDVFHGEVGNDVINGRLGNDQIFGGDGFDTITGGDGNDTVFGGNGQDRVFLGAGDDRFVDTAQAGALGQDTITGGAGADVFVFFRAMSVDVITDFAIGTDRLHLATALAGGRSAAQLEADAQVTASGVLLDFGSGDTLLLEALAGKAGLAGDILFV